MASFLQLNPSLSCAALLLLVGAAVGCGSSNQSSGQSASGGRKSSSLPSSGGSSTTADSADATIGGSPSETGASGGSTGVASNGNANAGSPSQGTLPSVVRPFADCMEAADGACSQLFSCAPIGASRAFGTVSTCKQQVQSACDAAAAASTPLDLQACASAVAASGCLGFPNNALPVSCWSPRGTVRDGGSCSDHIDCQSLICERKGTCGTCRAAIGEGQSCATIQACGIGLICDGAICRSASSVGDACSQTNICIAARCSNGFCAVPLGLGETCVPGEKTCSTQLGLVCNGTTKTCVADTATAPTCAADPTTGSTVCPTPAKLGDACSDTKTCMQPGNCQGGVCVAKGPSNSCI